MMYAIQGNNVRWFLSDDEEQHLFGLFDLRDVIAEVIVHGNWNEFLTFKPVVYKSRRSHNQVSGSYTVETIELENVKVKSIIIPIDSLKVARTTVNSIKPSGEVMCTFSRINRELNVYPMRLVEKKIIDQSVADVPEPVSSVSEQPAPAVDKEVPVETVGEAVSAPKPIAVAAKEDVLLTSMSESERIQWAAEVVTEINSLLKKHPEVAVRLENERVVKFSRKTVTRKVII